MAAGGLMLRAGGGRNGAEKPTRSAGSRITSLIGAISALLQAKRAAHQALRHIASFMAYALARSRQAGGASGIICRQQHRPRWQNLRLAAAA
jgi:hypothetical protein